MAGGQAVVRLLEAVARFHGDRTCQGGAHPVCHE